MEEYGAIQEHIGQLTKVQLMIRRYNFKQQRSRKDIQGYVPDGMYFTLRNYAEELRIQKLRLIKHKNKLQSKLSKN